MGDLFYTVRGWCWGTEPLIRSLEVFGHWLQLVHCTNLLSQCLSIYYGVQSLELGLGMKVSLEVVERRVVGGVCRCYGVGVTFA